VFFNILDLNRITQEKMAYPAPAAPITLLAIMAAVAASERPELSSDDDGGGHDERPVCCVLVTHVLQAVVPVLGA
jgi:hypothetical protein